MAQDLLVDPTRGIESLGSGPGQGARGCDVPRAASRVPDAVHIPIQASANAARCDLRRSHIDASGRRTGHGLAMDGRLDMHDRAHLDDKPLDADN